GSARFCAGPDRRLLPAPERLPAHDRTGDPSVQVEVARLHRVEPLAYLCDVEGMDTTGEAVVDLADVLEGLGQRFCGHDPEAGAEILHVVVLRAASDAVAGPR